MITWNASVPDSATGMIWYRFRVREAGGDYTMIRDYGPLASLDWTAADHEGLYEMEVSAKNRQTGELAATSSLYQMLSRVSSGGPCNQLRRPIRWCFSTALSVPADPR